MELSNQELGIIARSRVSKPYKRRIYLASFVAVVSIVAMGFPAEAHIWQLILVPTVATAYFIYAIWQGKGLELASKNLLDKWLNEITDERA